MMQSYKIGVNLNDESIPNLIFEKIIDLFHKLSKNDFTLLLINNCTVYMIKILTNYKISILQISKYRYYIFIKITSFTNNSTRNRNFILHVYKNYSFKISI